MKQAAPRGRTTKHVPAAKHGRGLGGRTTAKHAPRRQHVPPKAAGPGAVHTSAKPPAQAKPRKLALGQEVACCAAEALAASLRLTGVRVTDDDVLRLYRMTSASPDEGATLTAALLAASASGLAGRRPRQIKVFSGKLEFGAPNVTHLEFGSLILGVELPGSHAVTVGPDGAWWSWGEPYDPATWPDAVIEEAWAIAWQ